MTYILRFNRCIYSTLQLTFDEQVDQAREAYQPTPMEKFFSIMKSLILRALVVYFIMTFIKGSSKAPAATTPGGSSKAPVSASVNVYPNGTELVMPNPLEKEDE